MDLISEIAREHKVQGVDVRVATFSLFGMMNWIYNWYNPRKDVDAAGLSQHITTLFLSGFLGGKALGAEKIETGRESHLDRNVSVWQQ
jgi:hypothetical protein